MSPFGGTAVARKTLVAGACDRGDDAVGRNAADALVLSVRDVNIAGVVHREAHRDRAQEKTYLKGSIAVFRTSFGATRSVTLRRSGEATALA